MLAVLDSSVARCPEGLRRPEDGGDGSDTLTKKLSSTVSVSLGDKGYLAYSNEKQNPLLPRMFTVMDDIFCLFQGHISNMLQLKQQYGLSKTANEAIIVTEAYRTLRDRGPYPAHQVVKDLQGNFAFILFDASSAATFIAADGEGSVPFYWGADSVGKLVLSNDVDIVKMGCGKSFAPFPKGCFFTTNVGLQSYEHPLNQLKPVPRVDSLGEFCGANYKVDSEAKKDLSIARVGSEANWSSHY